MQLMEQWLRGLVHGIIPWQRWSWHSADTHCRGSAHVLQPVVGLVTVPTGQGPCLDRCSVFGKPSPGRDEFFPSF